MMEDKKCAVCGDDDENFVRAVTISTIAPKNTKSYTGRSTGSTA